MALKRNHLYGAVLVCLAGLIGATQAGEAQSSAVAKSGAKATKATAASSKTKTVKSAKSSKTAKSGKRVKTASKAKAKSKPQPVAAIPAQPVNPYLAYQNANPYLSNHPVNPFFASQASNPYLAYRYEKPNQVAQTAATSSAMRPTISKISFAPMPVTMYLQPNQRPTMAIATPCSAMEKMTGNNPMFKAMEQMAFGMIGNMNEAGFMPMIIEPVCT